MKNQPTTSLIQLEIDGCIARVSLSRSDKYNALNVQMITELIEVFAWTAENSVGATGVLESDDGIPYLRVLTLSGQGKHFCAGADINMMRDAGANSAEEEGISAIEADDIVSARLPYRSVQELIDLQLIKELNSSTLLSNGVLMPRMSVQSTTYQINIITDYAGSRAYLSTVVQFLNEGSELNFTVLSRNEANNAARFL